MKETSSVQVTVKEDGSVELYFASLNIDAVGGDDFKCVYIFDGENSAKFSRALKKIYDGSMQQMVESAFTKTFNLYEFYKFCILNGIDFEKKVL